MRTSPSTTRRTRPIGPSMTSKNLSMTLSPLLVTATSVRAALSPREEEAEQRSVHRRDVRAGPDRTGAAPATDEPVQSKAKTATQQNRDDRTNQESSSFLVPDRFEPGREERIRRSRGLDPGRDPRVIPLWSLRRS